MVTAIPGYQPHVEPEASLRKEGSPLKNVWPRRLDGRVTDPQGPALMQPWMNDVREAVEERLKSFLAAKKAETEQLAPDSMELVSAVSALTMRGGKRTRPMVLVAGYEAVDATLGRDLRNANAALELLQTYLLIHDDWMDRDESRRGGQSVWAALRDAHNDAHLGASLAILAGDLASTFASELITDTECPEGRLGDVLQAFWRIQREVFFGQHLDLVAHPKVEHMYDLKTGSYTVRGPLLLGALLANATRDECAALDRIAAPLGVAFQLRDELLGTFGDPNATGKPAGNDVRAGKLTVLIQDAQQCLNATQRAALEKVWGKPDASEAEVQQAVELLTESGARSRVEERLSQLVSETSQAIEKSPFSAGRLNDVVALLVHRDH